jgi:hypothetical protein
LEISFDFRREEYFGDNMDSAKNRKKIILTAHQPAYLPWLGYFDKIIRSDVFVFLDAVQYEERSFISRNKIKTPKGTIWLTVPVCSKGHRKSNMTETRIDNTQGWKKKHLNSIFLNYKKAPRFEILYPKLEEFYKKEFEFLADLCIHQLFFWLKEIDVEKRIVSLSQLSIQEKKSDLILKICEDLNANHYISGILGKDYIKEENFNRKGITIEYQDYRHPVYPQLWGDFIPNLSILDFCMNTDNYALIGGG